jgi:FKBP-type peptidyl-prolyl cis-trans isomerase SlyD
MKVAAQKVVTVTYTLTDEAEEVVDVAETEEPMTYLHGAGQLIPGVELALEGLAVGEEVEVDIDVDNAFGQYDEELRMEIPREELGEIADELEIGLELDLEFDEMELIVTVEEFNDEIVVVDANHELAGLNLHFRGKVLDLREATAEEIEHGHAHFEDEPCEEA